MWKTHANDRLQRLRSKADLMEIPEPKELAAFNPVAEKKPKKGWVGRSLKVLAVVIVVGAGLTLGGYELYEHYGGATAGKPAATAPAENKGDKGNVPTGKTEQNKPINEPRETKPQEKAPAPAQAPAPAVSPIPERTKPPDKSAFFGMGGTGKAAEQPKSTDKGTKEPASKTEPTAPQGPKTEPTKETTSKPEVKEDSKSKATAQAENEKQNFINKVNNKHYASVDGLIDDFFIRIDMGGKVSGRYSHKEENGLNTVGTITGSVKPGNVIEFRYSQPRRTGSDSGTGTMQLKSNGELETKFITSRGGVWPHTLVEKP